MCGIVGYIGKNKAKKFLVEGLSMLEYRGYDSAGISVVSDNIVKTCKTKGKIIALQELLKTNDIDGYLGIGHTRWATHGVPSDNNSHPHNNSSNTISIVHNGIIENYSKLKNSLEEAGYKFLSDTDTEVIVHLIDSYYEGNIVEACRKAVKDLEGSYALGVISSNEPDKLVAIRKDSPLVIGVNSDEKYIVSDIPALLSRTRDVYFLNDNEMAILTTDSVTITDYDGKVLNRDLVHIEWDLDSASKEGYEDFMLKEIFEQPLSVERTIGSKIKLGEKVNLENLKLDAKSIKNIFIIACGTAAHAGMVGSRLIENLSHIPTQTFLASEFRYQEPLVDKSSLCIFVSQSGETADTLGALKLCKELGARTLAITNVVGSSITREAMDVIYTYAGPEIAVASTKAYTSQLTIFYILALYLAEQTETLDIEKQENIKREILNISSNMKKILKCLDSIKNIAKIISTKKDVFFLGRSLDYITAMEASLKLKEISYIHSEAFAAGELKHGPIALIEQDVPVICVCTNKNLFDKMISNVKEVKSRGAYTIILSREKSDIDCADIILDIPDTIDILMPIISVIPLQLLAYYVTKIKNLDVDKPRNLAKSVTVE